jgi:hypothetical protein
LPKGARCLEATLDTGDDVYWHFAQVVGEVAGRVLLSRGSTPDVVTPAGLIRPGFG